MMLKTGNKNKGFSIMEVMVTTVILSLGTVLIYEAFFISLDAFNYCRDCMKAAPWADEKIWHAQDNLTRLGGMASLDGSGEFTDRNKNFKWNLSYCLIDGTQQLYEINLVLSWRQGQRTVTLSRSAYAIYQG